VEFLKNELVVSSTINFNLDSLYRLFASLAFHSKAKPAVQVTKRAQRHLNRVHRYKKRGKAGTEEISRQNFG